MEIRNISEIRGLLRKLEKISPSDWMTGQWDASGGLSGRVDGLTTEIDHNYVRLERIKTYHSTTHRYLLFFERYSNEYRFRYRIGVREKECELGRNFDFFKATIGQEQLEGEVGMLFEELAEKIRKMEEKQKQLEQQEIEMAERKRKEGFKNWLKRI